jgi:hypothetical protein
MAAGAEFVARLNIEHFRKKLAEETDEARRQTSLTLLAKEEAKLASRRCKVPRRSSASHSAATGALTHPVSFAS